MHFFNTKHIYGVVLNTKHMYIAYLNHCQWLVIGQWFSQGTPMSSNNKTDRTEITEIMLKVVINTITLTLFEPRRGPHYKIYVRISLQINAFPQLNQTNIHIPHANHGVFLITIRMTLHILSHQTCVHFRIVIAMK